MNRASRVIVTSVDQIAQVISIQDKECRLCAFYNEGDEHEKATCGAKIKLQVPNGEEFADLDDVCADCPLERGPIVVGRGW